MKYPHLTEEQLGRIYAPRPSDDERLTAMTIRAEHAEAALLNACEALAALEEEVQQLRAVRDRAREVHAGEGDFGYLGTAEAVDYILGEEGR